uniref:Aldose 1-epimerase n=1 Tax=Araucaria cunninghamii TaxID=56994 RepID=A0A0D6QXL2_ARACU
MAEEAQPQFFELHKGDLHVKLTNLGCTITSLQVPDGHGDLTDVVLGFDTLTPYMDGTSRYFGCIVGRVANRIKDAGFTLNGVHYSLPINNGPNTLHGGLEGFDKAVWKVEEQKNGENPYIKFSYHSYDGEQGFPGDLDVTATYTLSGDMELRLDMEAIPRNMPTPVSLAQHTYWNLAGHNSGNILRHSVQLWGSHVTPVDDKLIPTGELLPVEGTPFDFRTEKIVESTIDQIPGGYDHNYVLDCGESEDGLKHAVRVKDPSSKRVLDLWTNAPGMQFYTGNFVDGVVGKGGAVYGKHAGLCLETQGFPNAVNQTNFPSVIVYPGEVYKHTMVYKFSVDN